MSEFIIFQSNLMPKRINLLVNFDTLDLSVYVQYFMFLKRESGSLKNLGPMLYLRILQYAY
jgi:hypothetical protein